MSAAKNLQHLTDDFNQAVYVMELRWANLKGARKRYEPRLLARYARSLRRCARLRERLRELMETGAL